MSVYRRDKRITLALPDDFAGRELHAWLMVKTDDGRWSESTYVDTNDLQSVENTDPADDADEASLLCSRLASSSSAAIAHTTPDERDGCG